MTALVLPIDGAAAVVGSGCAHCGAAIGLAAGPFCCAGCAAAFEIVTSLGLDQYYARRVAAASPGIAAESPAFDGAAYTHGEADGTSSVCALIEGLRCAACQWLIESVLTRQEDVVSARLSYSTGRLRLVWRGAPERGRELLALVRRFGYRAVPYDPQRLTAAASREERSLLRAMAVAGFAAGNIMLLSIAVWAGNVGEMGSATRDLLHSVSALIALPAVPYAGSPFFTSALGAMRAGRANVDLPISVGVVLVSGMSVFETFHSGRHTYFDSAVTLLFFLLIGRYLELRARGRAWSAAETMLALGVAPTNRIAADGTVTRVPPAALSLGDTILVAAGERIAADGEVVLGRSEVDRSLIDGETMPTPVGLGSIVHAGMNNLAGAIRVRVTATGEATYLAEMVRLIEAAERSRARYVVLADRAAHRYATAVHLLALTTFAAWMALGQPWQLSLNAAIAVLVITCPCALGLAVPVVQVIAAGRLLRRGVLLKSATALERLSGVDTVVFDKTGTLTLGQPQLQQDAAPDQDFLATAAALAASSRHPLSRAICALRPDVPAALEVSEHPGEGLGGLTKGGEIRLGSRAFCEISTEAPEPDEPELWLTRPGRDPVRFSFEDPLRPDAAAVVAWLRRAGKRVLLLSGDRRNVVSHCAQNLALPNGPRRSRRSVAGQRRPTPVVWTVDRRPGRERAQSRRLHVAVILAIH